MKYVVKLKDELAKLNFFPRFNICSVGKKIMCSSLQQYKPIGDLLKNSTVVLRGLPSYEAVTVKDELVRLRLKPEALHLMVHFTKGSTTLPALKINIRNPFQVIIYWESYKPQHRDVTQCTSCLSFGHGTKNCHMKPRCDKCAMAHSMATCAQADDTELKCVNCGGTHRATSRDCPKRTKYINIRKKVATSNQPGRHRNKRTLPAITDEQYPANQPRRLVPNLPPLPFNNQRATSSAQHRLIAAAALP
ncbi:uncharacterized protein LOC135699362 [Ochlerotatus camptorhynchus]|uniref:uncharacterized protein LOC135699362 n=1 Tax=Ochlerotatus camptorhynchus TaxID=644619 RepID=UPI0031DEDBEB